MKNVQEFIKSRMTRLTFTYLALIMSMSIVFSFFIYTIASARISSSLLVETNSGLKAVVVEDQLLNQLLRQRAVLARADLLNELVILNLVMLIGGALVSYYLAKRTLRPIESAMDAQSQFVSDASHELKTPLTALQTMNEVALRKNKLTATETTDLIKQNIEEITKLRELSIALLGLAANDNSKLKISKVALQDVICDAMNQVVALAQEKDIAIDDQVPNVSVCAHHESLVRIVRILLENAIKYSDNSSSVVVGAKTNGSCVELDVSDGGIGISKEDQEKIFTRFYRVDNSRSKIKADGYGLGLAIAKDLASRQDIGLSVTSKFGKGSTFRLKLKKA